MRITGLICKEVSLVLCRKRLDEAVKLVLKKCRSVNRKDGT